MAIRRQTRKNKPEKRQPARIRKALKKFVQSNPRKVKGAKCNGGRSVSLRNFTGRVIRKRNGQVQIIGRVRKK
jgi:hypothetical protein